jgi:hypothetical protein
MKFPLWLLIGPAAIAANADELDVKRSKNVPELRSEFLEKARCSIRELLLETESQIGTRIAFVALPKDDPVSARFLYDTRLQEAQVQLRPGWEDVDVAHELIHTHMDLMDRFPMLAWKRGAQRLLSSEIAFARLQTYVKDEIVHARLVKMGLRLDGEVFRPPLFDSLYTRAAECLEKNPNTANDGLAHLDKAGLGVLCRACFLLQAELLLKNYRDLLPVGRVQQTERFIRAVRQHRPREAAHADTILKILEQHDIATREGHRGALLAWAKLEGIDHVVGASCYQKSDGGKFLLPFPD